MKIYPDYSKEHICYYCNKNKAVKEGQFEETWYGVLSNRMIPLSVKYIKVNIGIPRCQQCKSRHDKTESPYMLILFVSFIIGGYLLFFHNGGNGWGDSWWSWPLGIFVIGLIASFISFIIGTLIRYLIHSILYSNICKDLGDTRSYYPIKKLIDCGFQYERPDAAKGESYKKVDPDHFNVTLSIIHKKGNCIIKQ